MAMATQAPKYTAAIANTTCASVTDSMTAPVRQMKAVSPRAIPWSMMRAFRVGR